MQLLVFLCVLLFVNVYIHHINPKRMARPGMSGWAMATTAVDSGDITAIVKTISTEPVPAQVALLTGCRSWAKWRGVCL